MVLVSIMALGIFGQEQPVLLTIADEKVTRFNRHNFVCKVFNDLRFKVVQRAVRGFEMDLVFRRSKRSVIRLQKKSLL